MWLHVVEQLLKVDIIKCINIILTKIMNLQRYNLYVTNVTHIILSQIGIFTIISGKERYAYAEKDIFGIGYNCAVDNFWMF